MASVVVLLSACGNIHSTVDSSQGSPPSPGNGNGGTETPTPEMPEPEDALILTAARGQGKLVDSILGSQNHLMKLRNVGFLHRTDSCQSLPRQSSFAETISQMVSLNLIPQASDFAGTGVSSILELPALQDMVPTSLWSHPLCPVTKESLTSTIGEGKVPPVATIDKINQFVKKVNSARASRNKLELLSLYSRFYMCLSYVESLTTADTATSKSVAARVAPSGYVKPDGVKFYLDPQQTPASRLNIGLFQFTPNSGGNVLPCIRHWNRAFPSCSLSVSSSEDEMIEALGSAKQVFNTFCGVNKAQQMFSVQVNTRKPSSTHPSNWISSSALKNPGSRCVSLHFRSGNSYNHFGPFQNSTGSNLTQLMNCASSN